MQETQFYRLQIYVKKKTFSRLSQKMFSKVDCGVVRHTVNRLLRKVAVVVPAQVGKLVCNAVVNTPYSVLFAVWGIGICVCSGGVVLKFAAQSSGRGGCSICSMV